MIKFEVHSAELDSFNWVDKQGVTRTSHKQKAYVHLPEKPYPVEVKLRVDDPSKAYPPGVYTLGGKSFWVDRYGQLSCSPVLVPTAEKLRAAS